MASLSAARAAAMQRLRGSLERRPPVAQLAIRLVLRHAWQCGARRHGERGVGRRDHGIEALAEGCLQVGVGETQLERTDRRALGAELDAFAVSVADVLEGGAPPRVAIDHDLV